MWTDRQLERDMGNLERVQKRHPGLMKWLETRAQQQGQGTGLALPGQGWVGVRAGEEPLPGKVRPWPFLGSARMESVTALLLGMD